MSRQPRSPYSFDDYLTTERTLPSLREYVLVAQDRVAGDVLTRESDDRWIISSFERMDQQVPFESIGCTLPMAEIYARIQFPTKDA